LLRSLGFATDTAVDGQDAVRRLEASSFDVIVSDLSMPNLSGIEFLRAVRQHDLDVPVVLMTGQPGLESAAEAVEHGAFRYLTKPVAPERFADVMRSAAAMSAMAKLKREALALVGPEGKQLGDRASLEARFTNALERLWMAYQPIVRSCERAVFAYEALVRSTEPTLTSPLELLDAAERLGRVHDLGRRIREHVARAATDAPGGALLFVNLHAVDLNDPELLSPSSPLSAIAPRVVLEVTERASLHGVCDLSLKLRKLRQLGFRIAVDDLGAGYAGLASFSQLDPEFAKLDMSLVRDVDTSAKKQSVIRAMTKLCTQDLGIQVVSEGVESAQEQDALATVGCDLMQGYLFARPGRGFATPEWLGLAPAPLG
jgi:EAL domain-containing protein (putative c-di-GMP-specific phosphodiesterase class I)